ncbi:hypothetical protein J3A83DRAFT_4367325 [Scleroderma citrinum]
MSDLSCAEDCYMEDAPVPLTELWNLGLHNWEYQLDPALLGNFFELLQSTNGGECQLFPKRPTLVNEEISDSMSEPDFGIQLLDDDSISEGTNNRSKKTVSPADPYYPWLSKAHFITSLLFNSAHLLFSDAQKQAVLNWAKELGA